MLFLPRLGYRLSHVSMPLAYIMKHRLQKDKHLNLYKNQNDIVELKLF